MMINQFVAAESARAGIQQNLIQAYVHETFSQTGEDVIVETMLAAIALRQEIPQIHYLDIGANHPIDSSNTYLFYKNHNAHGVLFEADPELIPALERVRPRDRVVAAAVSARKDEVVELHVARAKELSSLDARHVDSFGPMGEIADVVRRIEVPNLHIRDVLAQYGQQPIHYLSIDVEGEDLPIMQAIDFDRHRPWILSCEPSAHVYPDNLQQMCHVMAHAGYALVARTIVNLIFVDKHWL